MMFEDLVLQSIRYDGDTITLTVPDLSATKSKMGNKYCLLGHRQRL